MNLFSSLIVIIICAKCTDMAPKQYYNWNEKNVKSPMMGIPKANVMIQVPNEKINIDRSPFTDELIFKGNDEIIFPKDNNSDNDIDLSGSFQPSSLKPSSLLSINLNALCNASVQFRLSLNLGANATSGIYTFPNGTRVQYAECKIVVVLPP